jgi:hypothetical protein
VRRVSVSSRERRSSSHRARNAGTLISSSMNLGMRDRAQLVVFAYQTGLVGTTAV